MPHPRFILAVLVCLAVFAAVPAMGATVSTAKSSLQSKAPASQKQEGEKAVKGGVTLVGKFSEPKPGGVVFTPDNEKNTVYVPMGAKTNPTDYLNIYVRIKAEVTDEFIKDGRTVKLMQINSIEPMTGEYGDTRTTRSRSFGVRGSAPVEITKYPDHTCYKYKLFIVHEKPHAYSQGNDIMVTPLSKGEDPVSLCESFKDRPHMLLENKGANHFYGMAGPWLFINDGTGADPHALIIVNMAEQKEQITAPFFQPVVLKDNRYLEFYSLEEDPPLRSACPQAAKWEKQGKKVLFKRKVRLDLRTNTVEKASHGSKAVDCYPEP